MVDHITYPPWEPYNFSKSWLGKFIVWNKNRIKIPAFGPYIYICQGQTSLIQKKIIIIIKINKKNHNIIHLPKLLQHLIFPNSHPFPRISSLSFPHSPYTHHSIFSDSCCLLNGTIPMANPHDEVQLPDGYLLMMQWWP